MDKRKKHGAWKTIGITLLICIATANLAFADPITITTNSPLPDATLNTAYNTQANAAGGTLYNAMVVDGEYGDWPGGSGYRWEISAGALPTGMSLQTNGGWVDEWYDQGYNYFSGWLPGQAKIIGTPTQTGVYNFTLKSICFGGVNVTKEFTITVISGQLSITTNSLPQGTQTVAYSATLQATGGAAPRTWSITSGSLQAGLSLNGSTGIISGTPTASGSPSITFQVTSSDNQVITKTLTLNILATCLISTGSPLPDATLNTAYNTQVNATGGILYDATGPDSEEYWHISGAGYLWEKTAGTLPPGMTLDSTNGSSSDWHDQGNVSHDGLVAGQAKIIGTPTQPGTYNFTLKATAYDGTISTKDFSVTVIAAQLSISTNSLPQGTEGVAYSTVLASSGGVVPYTWSIITGSLQDGLALNTGIISGTPTANGSTNITFQVISSDSQVVTKTLTILIAPPCSITTNNPLPQAKVGIAYNTVINAAGGIRYDSMIVDGQEGDYPGGSGYRWDISAGNLPDWASLQTTSGSVEDWYDQGNNHYSGWLPSQGLLTGSPTVTGTSTFTLRARDYNGSIITKEFSFTVNYNFNITTQTIPYGRKDVAYSVALNAAGAPLPYAWFVINGTLPDGITLNSETGLLSGSPTVTGTYNFTIQVAGTDSTLNPIAQKEYSLLIKETWDMLTGGDHKGQDWTLANGDTIGGEHYNIGTFSINEEDSVLIQTGSGMKINATNIVITGTLSSISRDLLELSASEALTISGRVNLRDYSYGGTDSTGTQGADANNQTSGAGGGGYGGTGGAGGGTSPGIGGGTRGTGTGNDIAVGSKGGNVTIDEFIDPYGGMGGRALFSAGQTLDISGIIDASGNDGENGANSGGGGGGSGGGILFNAQTINLTGFVFAKGGNGGIPSEGCGGGGGGSGGRVKLYYTDFAFNGIIRINGGTGGGNGAHDGAFGTISQNGVVMEAPHNAPTNLSAEGSSSSEITLTWQDNSDNEFWFSIERKFSSHDTFVQIASVGPGEGTMGSVSFSDSHLQPGKPCYYRVRACNPAGNSAYSDMSAAVTFAQIPTIDETIESLNIIHEGILQTGLYQSFLDGLNLSKYYLGLNDYSSALTPLNTIGTTLAGLTDTEMTNKARTYFEYSLNEIKDYVSLHTGSSTLNLSLSEFYDDSVIDFIDSNGAMASSALSGNLTVNLAPTANPDIVEMTVTQSAYQGAAITVNGANTGAIAIINDTENPSVGTLNLTNGHIELTCNLLMASVNFPNHVNIASSLKGTLYPVSTRNGQTVVVSGGITTSLFGGGKFYETNAGNTQDTSLVEMQINKEKAPGLTDYIVPRKSKTTTYMPKVPCRIRNKSNAELTVYLYNLPDKNAPPENDGSGKLSFSNAANSVADSITLVLPPDNQEHNNWVDFDLSGEQESQLMSDTAIVINKNNADGEQIGKQTATVVWVDLAFTPIPQGLDKVEVSNDNTCKPFYQHPKGFGKPYLGVITRTNSVQFGFEIFGTVKPNDYNLPLIINQEVLRSAMYIIKPDNSVSFSNARCNSKDNPKSMWSTIVPLQGKIYFLDGPGFTPDVDSDATELDIDTKIAIRMNFNGWVTLGTQINLVCSDNFGYYIRAGAKVVDPGDSKPKRWEMEKIAGGGANNLDNTIATGTTNLTIDTVNALSFYVSPKAERPDPKLKTKIQFTANPNQQDVNTSFKWSFGDGNDAVGENQLYTYAGLSLLHLHNSSFALARVKAENATKAPKWFDEVDVVAVVNERPMPIIRLEKISRNTEEQLVIDIDGSGSFDKDGKINTYKWTLTALKNDEVIDQLEFKNDPNPIKVLFKEDTKDADSILVELEIIDDEISRATDAKLYKP
ncbi:MAG: putative Ig domain-containing protein [Planctomycetes bacterium]|nr:putative Ig domain-containing protein [Planctomycetota bacterium]